MYKLETEFFDFPPKYAQLATLLSPNTVFLDGQAISVTKD
jgi:hypothetical protein